jgi:hypothetical protein
MNVLVSLLIIMATATLGYALRMQPSSRMISASVVGNKKRMTIMRRHISEHLAECANNPALQDVYGGLQGDYCIQNGGLINGFSGLFEQAVTIGFLIMSYYFFKRSAKGIAEWEEADDDDDDYYAMEESNSISGRDRGMRRCPQCNGTGKFEFDGDSSSSVCDLCNGAGMIPKSTKAQVLGLPKSSKALWNPKRNELEDDDEQF